MSDIRDFSSFSTPSIVEFQDESESHQIVEKSEINFDISNLKQTDQYLKNILIFFSQLLRISYFFQTEINLARLQEYFTAWIGDDYCDAKLREDISCVMKKLLTIIHTFKQMKLTMEEYVCLKVITLLGNGELNSISNEK